MSKFNVAVLVIVAIALVVATTAVTTAARRPSPCPTSNPAGLILTESDYSQAGEIRCEYGYPNAELCHANNLEGGALIRTVIRANGQIRCFYTQIETRGQ